MRRQSTRSPHAYHVRPDQLPRDSRTKVLLLAAGRGTRLRPVTDAVPKCLVPIDGRPLLDFWLDRFREASLREVLINTHHLRERVVDYLEEVNRRGDVSVRETFEPELLGSAGTVRANASFCDDVDDCVIVYADNLSAVNLREFLTYHRAHDEPFTMALFRSERPRECGIAALDEDGLVTSFIEKPADPPSNLANAGIYAVTREAYREIAAMEGDDLGFDVLPRYVGRMRGWRLEAYHRDIGTLDALERARADAPEVFARKP